MASTFSMSTRRTGRTKYLLLTMVPPLVVTYMFEVLVSTGILPGGKIFGFVYIGITLALMILLGYFFIFKKNHEIEITENEIHHKDWRGRTSIIPIHRVHTYYRNWLKEYILLDSAGKSLVCIESNMHNLNLFEQWLKLFIDQNKE